MLESAAYEKGEGKKKERKEKKRKRGKQAGSVV